MKKKSQQGVALIWMIIAGALLVTSVGALVSKKEALEPKEFQLEASLTPTPTPTLAPSFPSLPMPEVVVDIGKDIQEMIDKQMSDMDKDLLKILPPKEKAELQNAINEAQQVLKNIQPFNPSDIINTKDMFKGLDEINKQTQEQIQKNMEKQQQEFQPIDPKKIEEHFNQNPPAVPQDGKEFSPEEQEYYYRKHILKDPAFQW